NYALTDLWLNHLSKKGFIINLSDSFEKVKLVKDDLCIEIFVIEPYNLKIDTKSGRLMSLLINKHIWCNNIWNTLSTIGGAYGSLECSPYFSLIAQKFSIIQYRIASTMNNEIALGKCLLFFTYSLIQLNNIHFAKRYLRYVKDKYGRFFKYDVRLKNMWEAGRVKLKRSSISSKSFSKSSNDIKKLTENDVELIKRCLIPFL
ncbi:hypothetical protein SNEBB_004080, partial [Seison nebaliae]